MNNSIEEQEKAILYLIDRYNEEAEKDRLYFFKYRKNNPDSGLSKDPFSTFYKTFETRATNSEVFDFLYEFGNLRLLKTFHLSSHAESLIQSFEKLNIPIPHFVSECQKEVRRREEFIKSYLEKERFKWSKSNIEDFILRVQKESKTHSFDAKSEREYLKKKFKETIQEVRKIEKEIKKRFGYIVENYFDSETFTLSKEALNEYFYHSEIALGGCGSFFEVYKTFDNYVGKKNEVFAFRAFLSSQKDSIGLESIWMVNPKIEIEYVLKKGFDKGIWDEKNRLQTKRGGTYGHGKSFLSNLYHSLIGNSIKTEIPYEQIGKILCEFFKVEIGEANQPFKTFQNRDPKKIELIKKDFKLY